MAERYGLGITKALAIKVSTANQAANFSRLYVDSRVEGLEELCCRPSKDVLDSPECCFE